MEECDNRSASQSLRDEPLSVGLMIRGWFHRFGPLSGRAIREVGSKFFSREASAKPAVLPPPMIYVKAAWPSSSLTMAIESLSVLSKSRALCVLKM